MHGLRARVGWLGVGLLVTAGAVGRPVPVVAREDPDFIRGSGGAEAHSFRIVPHSAGLEVPITMGKAAAAYEGVLAKAESTTVSLGTIEASLGEACGQASTLPSDYELIPAPLLANSRHGEKKDSHDEYGGGPVGAGRESVYARPNALARAANLITEVNLADEVVVRDGHTTSEAELIPGHRRRGVSTAELGEISLAGGLVRMTGLKWHAEHVTGAGKGLRGSFVLGGLSLAGTSLPVDTPEQLQTSVEDVNKQLGPLGARLELPRVVRSDNDLILDVTPLKLVVGEGTTGGEFVGPILHDLQPVRDEAINAIAGLLSCDTPLGRFSLLFGVTVILADILLGAFTGVASTNLEFGGVKATTEGFGYSNPFLNVPPFVSAGPVTLSGRPPSFRDISRLHPGEAAPATIAGGSVRSGERCESIHSGGSPGCSKGLGLVAGFGAAAAAALLFGADLVRSRRSRRRSAAKVSG